MAVVKVIELLAEGETVEAAMESAVNEAAKTVRGIRHVYLENLQAIVEDNQIAKYRVNAKISFLVQ